MNIQDKTTRRRKAMQTISREQRDLIRNEWNLLNPDEDWIDFLERRVIELNKERQLSDRKQINDLRLKLISVIPSKRKKFQDEITKLENLFYSNYGYKIDSHFNT